MTTGSPAASRTCRRPTWKLSASASVRPKNAGTPGLLARAARRSALAAPSRSDAHASTPASVTATAAVRIWPRQEVASARWSRSAVRTGSAAVVSGVAGERDTVDGRYARSPRGSTDFRWPAVPRCEAASSGSSSGMASDSALPPVIGAIADDRDGNALGTITTVFLDDVTEQPSWVGLTPGLHASADTDDVPVIAPVTGAQFAEG